MSPADPSDSHPHPAHPSSDADVPQGSGPGTNDVPEGSGAVRAALAAKGVETHVVLPETPQDFRGPSVRPQEDKAGSIAELGSKYRVLGEIAAGGMGIILKCRDADIGRDVAVKVLHERYRDDPQFLQRFIEEAQINGQLQHPGIVPVYDVGIEDRRPYFTMKLIKGRTLSEILKARADAKADRQRFLGIFLQVCQTVAYAHARGVIHRDLKPSNIMVGAFGEVLVVDWGLAKVLPREKGDGRKASKPRSTDSVIATVRTQGGGTHSLVGSVLGTPSYMPPEQAAGDIERLDERSDVFSLGAMLCEILTGRPPYDGQEVAELVRQAASGRMEEAQQRLESCGADLDLVELVRDCLRPAPSLRPANAGELAERIGRHMASVESRANEARIAAAQEGVKAAAARRAQRLTVALAAAVLCVILVGAIGYFWVERERESQATRATMGINDALQEAARLRGQDQEPRASDVEQALAVLRSAERFLETRGVPGDLRSRTLETIRKLEGEGMGARARAEQALRDERMHTSLEQIMVPPDSDLGLTGFETREALRKDASFEQAFKDHGLDLRTVERGLAVAKIRESAIRVDLAAALEDWAAARQYLQKLAAARGGGPRADPSSWRYLLEIARDADDEPLRRKHRDSILTDQFNVQALDDLVSAADLTAVPPVTVVLLAGSFQRLGRPESALSLLQTAQRYSPGDFNLNLRLGMALEGKRPPDWPEAIRFYTAALSSRPRSLVALHRLGTALEASGRADAALEVFQEAIRLNPRHSDWHSHRRRILQSAKKDIDGAIEAARAAIEIDPSFAAERLALARLYTQKAMYREAAAAYGKGLELEGMTWVKWRAMGHADRYDAARTAVMAALIAPPGAVVRPGRPANEQLDPEGAAWLATARCWIEDELQLKRLCLVGRERNAPAKIRDDLSLWLADGALRGVREEEDLVRLPPEERKAWKEIWARVGNLVAQLGADLPPPSVPQNSSPIDGSSAASEVVVLRSSAFQAPDPRSIHGFSVWQVRASNGDYSRDPVFSALSHSALVSLALPRGLLLPRSTYFWRVDHISEDGRFSGFSDETSFTTGDLPWESRPVDLSLHFTHDLVAGADGHATDSIDYGEGFLIEEGFDGRRADNPAARGLPRSRAIGVHRLGDHGKPNAVQLTRSSSQTVRVEVPRARYVAFRFLLTGGNGTSKIPLNVAYADGSSDRKTVPSSDWFEDLPPNGFGPLAEGVLPIWNGMDRLFAGRFDDANSAALFEVILPVRDDVEVDALVFDPAGAVFDQDITRFNLFAVTGMAAR